MPRRVEDIVPSDRRPEPARDSASSRRPSSPEGARPAHTERTIPIHRLKVTPPHHPPTPPRRRIDWRRHWKWLASAGIIVVVVAVSGYAASTRFAHATFTIAPVVIPVQADVTLVAAATTTPGYLTYKAVRFTDTASLDVPASDGPAISTKATGKVTLYNAYGAASQRLLAGTRIANGSGLIYRLTNSVVIPGYSGANKTPGTLVATIVADQPGAQYNVAKADSPGKWQMVAFQGGPRYDAVYALLASDVYGGFAGVKKTVSPALTASTTANLSSLLTSRLLAEAKAAVPTGYILYDGAYKASFSAPVLSGTASGMATITVNGTIYAAMLKVSDLVAKLAGADKVATFGSFAYTTQGLDQLSFAIVNQADFSPAKGTAMIARAKGSIKLIGTVPVDAIKAKLLGLPLSDTRKILDSYSAVVDVGHSSGEIFPSWTTSVPDDQSRVSITLLTK